MPVRRHTRTHHRVAVVGGCWGVWECKGGGRGPTQAAGVCSHAGRWDTAGAGEVGCAPEVGPCAIKMTSAGSSGREGRQLPLALSGQEDPEQKPGSKDEGPGAESRSAPPGAALLSPRTI